jgi:hypothetical protein
MALRIYADFNSGDGTATDPCWCQLYGSPLCPLDEVADDLNLCDGMPVLLYYADPSEDFEVSAAPSKARLARPALARLRRLDDNPPHQVME